MSNVTICDVCKRQINTLNDHYMIKSRWEFVKFWIHRRRNLDLCYECFAHIQKQVEAHK